MTQRFPFGQRVVVDPGGVRGDLLERLTEPIRGRVTSLPFNERPDPNAVLVSFDESGDVMWVQQDYVSAADVQ